MWDSSWRRSSKTDPPNCSRKSSLNLSQVDSNWFPRRLRIQLRAPLVMLNPAICILESSVIPWNEKYSSAWKIHPSGSVPWNFGKSSLIDLAALALEHSRPLGWPTDVYKSFIMFVRSPMQSIILDIAVSCRDSRFVWFVTNRPTSARISSKGSIISSSVVMIDTDNYLTK